MKCLYHIEILALMNPRHCGIKSLYTVEHNKQKSIAKQFLMEMVNDKVSFQGF